jgi:hypothetical protein
MSYLRSTTFRRPLYAGDPCKVCGEALHLHHERSIRTIFRGRTFIRCEACRFLVMASAARLQQRQSSGYFSAGLNGVSAGSLTGCLREIRPDRAERGTGDFRLGPRDAARFLAAQKGREPGIGSLKVAFPWLTWLSV